MKLKNYILAVLLALAVSLQSCEKDVANFKINTTPMLVTTAFISPQDTALVVELKRTHPAIGKRLSEDQMKVKDATVTLSDGAQQVQLNYNSDLDRYMAPASSLAVVAGKAYFLKVSTPSGEQATAECVVPALTGIRVTELNYEESPAERYGYSFIDLKLNFKWQDAPGVENYYHMLSYRTYEYTMGYYPPERIRQFQTLYADNDKIFATDAKQDGQILHSPDFMLAIMEPDHATKPFAVVGLLAVTDKAYHDYHMSILKQEKNGGNPFAEPSRIYSNMRGSLGVFAAYNQIKVMKVME